MSALFFDSSSLVKRYAKEVGTNWVFSLVRLSANNRLYLARITGVEVIAALTKRMRVGSLTTTAAAKAVNRFEREFSNRYLLIETTPQIIQTAMTSGKESLFARLRCRPARLHHPSQSRQNLNRRRAADFYFSRQSSEHRRYCRRFVG